jgi:hypothetical protein
MTKNKINQGGNFRGLITEYGLRESPGGALMLAIRADLTEHYDGEAWSDWGEYQVEAFGSLVLIKKDGNPNKSMIEAIVESTGWDGDIDSITDSAWIPTVCQMSIKGETYEGVERFNISWLSPFYAKVGGLRTLSGDEAKKVATKYRAKIRAAAGQASPQAGSAPPPPAQPAGDPPKDGIPF